MNHNDLNRPSTASSVRKSDSFAGTKKALIIIIAGALILFRVTGPLAYYIFSVGDNLNLTYQASPYIIWGIYGAFAGAIFGGIIACKKFRLKYIYVFYPFCALLLLLIILVIYNANFKSHHYTWL